ncbi:hypothetical protein [Lysobacter gummosus]|uniref:hypothetical protein n=1 Tax=Lysobacter gummosus TaxID=262324 RepID=UPI003632E546
MSKRAASRPRFFLYSLLTPQNSFPALDEFVSRPCGFAVRPAPSHASATQTR